MKYSLQKTINNEMFNRLAKERTINLYRDSQKYIDCDLWCILKEQLSFDLLPSTIYDEVISVSHEI